ncbi:hypothetical protein HY492_01505 [Candidatus Woesearchaeota archaeon]|nr:hypothetical protein [Candidatus Woesearchaeota archaeon]
MHIEFAKNAKTIQMLEDAYDRDQAQEIAERHKAAAFGTLTGIMKAFDRSRGDIILTGYRKRFEPFWHIQAESFFEYKRKNTYQFPVAPEVQSVTIAKHTLKVHPDEPVILFEGTDHCFEHFRKETVQDALREKGKDYAKYLDSKSKFLRDLKDLQRSDHDIMPVQIRASYLLNMIYKDIIKPIQADEVLDERVVINKLTLYLAPIHVFEFKEENRDKQATIEVDGITGTWQKGVSLVADLTKKYWSGETVFDISTEVAGNILPGAGVAMLLTKKIFDTRKERKTSKHHKELHKDFSRRKK